MKGFKVKKEWKHGDKAELAKKVGIAPETLTMYLQGRQQPKYKRAKALCNAAWALGYDIPIQSWWQPREYPNPLIQVKEY